MLKIDLHTHSIISGHALNTVYELIDSAHDKNITHLGIIEHGSSMEGAPHEGYFWVSDLITERKGIKIYMGIEANVIDSNGTIDLLDIEILKKQRLVFAGLHSKTPYKGETIVENTFSLLNAMENKFIKIISHPYRPNFPIDIEKIMEKSYEKNILLELNNNLFGYKQHINELIYVYSKLINYCKKKGMYVLLGSDSHVADNIGNVNNIEAIKEKIGIVDEIIINNYPDILENFLDR